MIGLIACLLGFAVLIYLSYKDWSIYLAAFAAACVVIFLTGMPFVETLDRYIYLWHGPVFEEFLFPASVRQYRSCSVSGTAALVSPLPRVL